jgi:Domain of unknown function (DUF4258)
VRFSRHAKNEMRLYGISPLDVMDAITDDAGWISLDEDGNIVVIGNARGQRLTVVVARDELDLVITIYGGRRRRR